MRPPIRFIAGEPIKLATNRFSGWSYNARGEPICSMHPSRMTTILCAMVLDLVVCDIDRRRSQPLVQFLDLCPHLHAKFRIEVRQRFIEQEHLRIADDGPAHGDALALAAGELPCAAASICRSLKGQPG